MKGDDFVSTRHLIGAHLIKVWILQGISIWDALDTTVYNPRQLGGGGGRGGGINWAEILGGWSLLECFASSQVLLHPPSMSGRWHRHLMWSCELQENTLPCVWWGNPLTPYKHCHTGSAHPGRTEVTDLLSKHKRSPIQVLNETNIA